MVYLNQSSNIFFLSICVEYGLLRVLSVDKEMFQEALIKIFLEFIGVKKVLDKTVGAVLYLRTMFKNTKT